VNLLLALFLTWLIEWAVAAVLFRHGDFRLGYCVLLINAFTNPLANFAYLQWRVSFWLVEASVVVVEVPLYRFLLRTSWARGLLLSAGANFVSALAGLAWQGNWLP
jgi:hypothetical protein